MLPYNILLLRRFYEHKKHKNVKQVTFFFLDVFYTHEKYKT